tara:strand:+ start:27 stop:818 length:792 start_codon:yes stop_codon:yes gene_type:complete
MANNMNSEDWYKAVQNRYTCSYFKQDDIPEKSLIEKILDESLKATPVFSCVWHHEIEIYGPEFFYDKKKMAIQGVSNVHMRKLFDTRYDGLPGGSNILTDYFNDFCEYVEEGKARDFGFRGQYKENDKETFVPFNTQLLAPYLLAFKIKPYNYDSKTVTDTKLYDAKDKGLREKAFQSSMTQAYAISVIATHYNVDVGFCGCFIHMDDNENEIWHNTWDLVNFVGLGYAHDGCFEGPNSKHGRMKNKYKRPSISDICTWKEKK